MKTPKPDAYAPINDQTSQTDNQRIKDITVLPPPEHLIRFFPIAGTAVESLIAKTRQRIHKIMTGKDDRLLVVMGPQIQVMKTLLFIIQRKECNIL
jgi:3-deoxy-7-phosphoheptulonate synthase